MKQILHKKNGRWGFVNESERYESLILHLKKVSMVLFTSLSFNIQQIYCKGKT